MAQVGRPRKEGFVNVISKLPNGLRIHVGEGEKKQHFDILGFNSSRIIGATEMINEVPQALWEAFVKEDPNFSPLKSSAISVSKDDDSAKDIAKDLKAVKTGLEQLSPPPIASPENGGIVGADA